jgi:hypothetical protein
MKWYESRYSPSRARAEAEEMTTDSRIASTGVEAMPLALPSRNDRLSTPSAIVSKPKTARVNRV